ncbi:MAG TPA: EAL domain-containing protein [Micavibrio sp.]|nr:EAL domain-containing protein [Micavibrio sp.]HIL28573.1 EAL domain-containing protein [Micavibrio sp.]
MEGSKAQRDFKAGDIIMRQGDKGDYAYIIEEGLVEILIERPDSAPQQVGTRGAGTIIGEMAIVDDAPRTATVKALEDCKMLAISRDDFSQRLKSSDPVIQMISQVILTRYRDTLTRVEILGSSGNHPPAEAIERGYAAQSDVVESVKIANEFKTAIENGDLELHYQPIVDLSNGRVKGFEALMRWTHATEGFISPGIFIPIAEKSGIIVEASKWAVKEACAALNRIETALGNTGEMYMSVNFSSHDFATHGFVDGLKGAIKNGGIRPEQLILEITERLLIQQPDNAKETLQKCREQGIGIAIDDFGTGYSSLSYLYYFPINILKVDQSFVRSLFLDDKSLELVKSIIGLGKNMDLRIIAEGVENREEAHLLTEIGCDTAQGYYFARPMPEDQVIETLSSWKADKLTA